MAKKYEPLIHDYEPELAENKQHTDIYIVFREYKRKQIHRNYKLYY